MTHGQFGSLDLATPDGDCKLDQRQGGRLDDYT